jgi:hypothetical protein
VLKVEDGNCLMDVCKSISEQFSLDVDFNGAGNNASDQQKFFFPLPLESNMQWNT